MAEIKLIEYEEERMRIELAENQTMMGEDESSR